MYWTGLFLPASHPYLNFLRDQNHCVKGCENPAASKIRESYTTTHFLPLWRPYRWPSSSCTAPFSPWEWCSAGPAWRWAAWRRWWAPSCTSSGSSTSPCWWSGSEWRGSDFKGRQHVRGGSVSLGWLIRWVNGLTLDMIVLPILPTYSAPCVILSSIQIWYVTQWDSQNRQKYTQPSLRPNESPFKILTLDLQQKATGRIALSIRGSCSCYPCSTPCHTVCPCQSLLLTLLLGKVGAALQDCPRCLARRTPVSTTTFEWFSCNQATEKYVQEVSWWCKVSWFSSKTEQDGATK